MIAALVLPLAGSTFEGCLAAGPCIIEYRDAVVHLGAVRDSASGAFLDARYSKVHGGCPGYVDRGTLLALRLARAPVP